MDNRNRTAWYPPNIRPVRVGWYETSSDPKEYYLLEWWDGFYFCDHQGNRYLGGKLFWRGLTEQAK